MFGFLNINKPSGMTSHKIISVLRKVTGLKQIGHAGTLDPLASGVLPVAVGKATKLIDYLDSDKRYITGLEFGKRSDTYDIQGNIETLSANPVNKQQIESVLNLFKGEIKQIPPAFSAVHYNGKRLYELARNGKIPDDIPSRTIKVYKNEIIDFDEKSQKLKLDIACSKGTYIRSIVNDLGIALNTGAVMFELTRIKSAGMELNSALNIDENLTKDKIEKNLISPICLLPFKSIEIEENQCKYVLNGNKIKNTYNIENEVFLTQNGKILCLAIANKDFIQPKKILT